MRWPSGRAFSEKRRANREGPTAISDYLRILFTTYKISDRITLSTMEVISGK